MIRHLVIAAVLAVLVPGCVGRRHGTSRELYVQQVGERGRWFAACQPTRDTDGDGRIEVRSGPHGEPSGDALTLFLHLESGPPLIIDALHAATPDERLLAVAMGGQLVLVDVLGGQRTDVGPAPAWSPIVSRVGFSRDGATLLVLVDGALWVREVPTGRTTRIELPPGEFGWPESGPGGSIFLRELSADTDGDGKRSWERADTTLHLGVCSGPAQSWSVRGRVGDVPSAAIVTAGTGDPVRVSARLHPFDSGYVAVTDGNLTWHDVDGTVKSMIGPDISACVPTLLHVDPTREVVLFHCGQGHAGMLHGWSARAGAVPLAEFRGVVEAYSAERYPRLVRVFPSHMKGDPYRSQTVLDLDTLSVEDVQGVPTHTAGGHLITRTWRGPENGRLWDIAWLDIDSGARRLLEASEWKPNAAAGDFVLLGDDLYDMRTGAQVGTFYDHGWSWKTCRLVGMDASGRVLARAGCDDRGPLLWVQPADD